MALVPSAQRVKYRGARDRVLIEADRVLSRPLYKVMLRFDDRFNESLDTEVEPGTNFPVSAHEAGFVESECQDR